MDSGNSGSMQSSSGGEEEYDSRAASISSFFTTPMSHPPPPFQHHHHPSTAASLFDPFSHPPLPNPSPLLNPTQRPDPIFGSQPQLHSPFASSPAVPFPPVTENTTTQVGPPRGKNPKKRSRASRRAPTTVLTTDTTNFKSMVQEFTGIPSPPFIGGGLDLYRAPSTIRSHPYSNILRPFAHKVHANSNNITSGPSTSNNSPFGPLGYANSQLQFQFPQPDPSILGSNAQDPSKIRPNGSNLKMGVFDTNVGFGSGHDHISMPPLGGTHGSHAVGGDQDHLRGVNSNFGYAEEY